MAGKRRRYILTETAEQDFREARGWSLSRWGRELTKQYFTDLHQCAERIARSSARFAPMEHVPNTAELSVYPIREHYLVYVPIREKRIAIVALIRQTRDVPAILNANGFVIRRQLKKILAKPAPVNSAWNSFFLSDESVSDEWRSIKSWPSPATHPLQGQLLPVTVSVPRNNGKRLKRNTPKPPNFSSGEDDAGILFVLMAQKRAGQRSARVEPRAAKHGVRHL